MQNNTFSPLIVGQKIVALQSVDSTNSYLRIELANSAPLAEGTVIMAEDQYAGRGQLNNNWHSQPGKNLTISILLNPSFLRPDYQFKLNIAISLAINDTLKDIGINSKIKWPNDVYYNDNKIGGVLIENILSGQKWKHAIVGIGLNVNQTQFPLPVHNISSIKEILQQDYDKERLLQQLCKAIDVRYSELKKGAGKQLDEYLDNLFWFNETHVFSIGKEKQEGKIVGLDQAGRLLIEIGGATHSFNMKEVSFVIP